MRKINFLFVLVLFTLVLLSVASLAFAQTTNKTLELSEFQSIYVNSNYTVYVKQTNKQEVKVRGIDRYLFPHRDQSGKWGVDDQRGKKT